MLNAIVTAIVRVRALVVVVVVFVYFIACSRVCNGMFAYFEKNQMK